MGCSEIRSGQLRDKVTIQTPQASTAGEYGEVIDTWGTLATVCAEVVEVSGYEAVKAAQVSAEATIKVTTRYRADVSEDMRLKFGDRLFYPDAIIRDVRKSSLTWFCTEERQ